MTNYSILNTKKLYLASITVNLFDSYLESLVLEVVCDSRAKIRYWYFQGTRPLALRRASLHGTYLPSRIRLCNGKELWLRANTLDTHKKGSRIARPKVQLAHHLKCVAFFRVSLSHGYRVYMEHEVGSNWINGWFCVPCCGITQGMNAYFFER